MQKSFTPPVVNNDHRQHRILYQRPGRLMVMCNIFSNGALDRNVVPAKVFF